MSLYVGLQEWKNVDGAFHDSAPDEDKFRIICMNQSHDIRSPNAEAAIRYIPRHTIALN
jgi:hypothetical protein